MKFDLWNRRPDSIVPSHFRLPVYAIFAFLAMGVFVNDAQGAIVVDATATQVNVGASTTITWTHTVGAAGSNRALIVFIGIRRNGVDTTVAQIDDVTFTDSNMVATTVNSTQDQPSVNGDENLRAEVFYLLPVIPGTYTISANIDHGTASEMIGYSYSVVGVGSYQSAIGNNNVTANDRTTDAPNADEGNFVADMAIVQGNIGQTGIRNAALGQIFVNDQNTGGAASNLAAFTSRKISPFDGGGVLGWFLSGNTLWAQTAISFRPLSPTAVDLRSFEVTSTREGAVLRWQSGFEARNLGYHLYRESQGQKIRITPEIIAGSALSTRGDLSSGNGYAWIDRNGSQDAVYWLEDIDVDGTSNMRGPFHVRRTDSADASVLNSKSIAEVFQTPLTGVTRPYDGSLSASAKGGGSGGGPSSQWSLAARAAAKITVRESGWYRVTQEDLASAGIDVARLDPRFLQLFLNGQPVAISIVGDQDGKFDSGDYVEFFGFGGSGLQSDSQVYWLAPGSSPGLRIKVLPSAASAIPQESFAYTVQTKERLVYLAALNNGDGDNFFGRIIASQPVNQSITISHLDPNSSSGASIEVALQGATDGDHNVAVAVNGIGIGSMSFKNRDRATSRLVLPGGVLQEGSNLVTFQRLGNGTVDVSAVDDIRVTYSHLPVAESNEIGFAAASRQPVAAIGGFTNPNIRVIDLTNPVAPVALAGSIVQGQAGYTVSVRLSPSVQRRLYAFTAERFKRPVRIELNRPSTLNAAGNEATYVLVAPRQFFSELTPLVNLRSSQGHRVAVVDIEDVYDEFNFGVKSADAIKAFVSRARSAWRITPGNLVLVGDATFDPKNQLGIGDFDVVPTKLLGTELFETASDGWFGDSDGDDIPEIGIGRLPVRTVEELTTVVSKIVLFESSGGANRRALLVSDSEENAFFEDTSAVLRANLPPEFAVDEIHRSTLGDSAAHQATMAGINSGAGIVSYAGHGASTFWRGNVLTTADASSFTNSSDLALFTIFNCLNGYFQDTRLDSLAESLLKAPGGGAVAVWSSSGSTDLYDQRTLAESFYRALFTGGGCTLGDAANAAKIGMPRDMRRSWTLLGDPATRIQ